MLSRWCMGGGRIEARCRVGVQAAAAKALTNLNTAQTAGRRWTEMKTMRLIDADVLKTDLTRFYGNEVTAKRLIDEQPTVDAILIEWLREWQDEVGALNEWWPIIERIITVWREEQEARQ